MTVSNEADSTRQRIIDAAFGLFTTQGYARTTTRAIAAAADVNEVTLFRHFGSKKKLFIACVQNFNAGGFAENFEEHLTGDYAADIRIMAQLQRQGMAQNYSMLRLMLCEATEMAAMQEAARVGGQQNHARIADYFRRQIAAGVVRDDLDPDALAHACDSLFSTAEFYRQTFQSDFMPGMSPETLIDQLVAVFVQGTVAHA